MLRKAALKISLAEPTETLLDMVRLMQGFGTVELHLLHVTSGSDRKLSRRAKRLKELAGLFETEQMKVQCEVSHGPVPGRIVSMAKERDVDYLGLYWMRKALLAQAILGSIDADILRQCDMPILVYNRSLMSASTRLKRILYATDFQATDQRVLPYLQSRDLNAESLVLLNVGRRAPDPATEHSRIKWAQKHLDWLVEQCEGHFDQVDTLQAIGNYRSQILKKAHRQKADLIVIGKADAPKPLRNLMGSTAEAIADRSKRSVFIVPGVH